MSICQYMSNYCVKLLINIRYTTTMFLSISLIEFVKDKLSFFDNSEDKIAKYWPKQTKKEILEEADALFEDQKYMQVYENLNRIKYSKDIEVIWRLAKSLYHLSLMEDITVEIRKEMIEEAHDILESTDTIGKGKCNYHKWMAVISNTKNGFESLETKIQEYPNIRDHLNEACKNNPRDFTVQYMLGRWHYEMANLTWFQRKIAKYLYLEPPMSTFEDAHRHLIKAEELQPRTFLPNIYILGSVCMQLGQYYRAKYYLNLALNIPTECDKCCLLKAKRLLTKLERYDLGKDLLHENYEFGFAD